MRCPRGAKAEVFPRLSRSHARFHRRRRCYPATQRGSRISGGATSFKADCSACDHVAPLTPEAMLRLGPSPHLQSRAFEGLDSKGGSGAVAFDAFVETYQVKYQRAVNCPTQDCEALLAFCDLAAEQPLRTTNAIESTFATAPAHLGSRSPGHLYGRHLLCRRPKNEHMVLDGSGIRRMSVQSIIFKAPEASAAFVSKAELVG